MTLKVPALFLLASVIVLVAASPGGQADAPDAIPPLPEAVSVTLRAIRTTEAGAWTDAGSAGTFLHVGGEGSAYLTAGEFGHDGRPERTLCTTANGSIGAGGTLDEAIGANAVDVWILHARLLDATMDRIRIAVDWSRQEASRRGELLRAAGDLRTLTLREGDSHTLDFVSAPDGDLACGRSLRLDVVTEVNEDPRFADALLGYDLWLLDEAPGGPALAQHVVLGGRQGERVDFAFEPLTWPLDGVVLQGHARGRVLAQVTGTIRGRLRGDGVVDIVLDAHRQVGADSDGSGASGGVPDGGRKVLRVREGETLALVLPPAQGVHALALDGSWQSASSAPGMTLAAPPRTASAAVTRTSESVSVDFGGFLAGHVMSLRLTARRR